MFRKKKLKSFDVAVKLYCSDKELKIKSIISYSCDNYFCVFSYSEGGHLSIAIKEILSIEVIKNKFI